MMPWVTFALWIVPLVGRLHAASLAREPSLSMEALSFNLLAELSCERGLNWTSPTNVEGQCYSAALGHFVRMFQQAADSCEDEDSHIPQALEELERRNWETQAACTLTMQTHATFAGFVKAATEFAQQYNEAQVQRK